MRAEQVVHEPLEVPAEYLQAAAPARPGTSAGRVETEEELRVRLLAAESVMRKLYRRNSQLEEQQKEQQRRATSGRWPTPGRGRSPRRRSPPGMPCGAC